MIKLRIITTLMLFQSVLSAQIEMPSIFNNNMVLQQKEKVSIWGTDKPNTTVTVKGSWNESAKTSTDKYGKWKLRLQTPSAGGPYTLYVEGSNKVTFNDVLIGEVWLCSGQSNMEMPLKGYQGQPITGSAEAILNSTNNNIRLFTVERNPSLFPIDTVKGEWQKTTPLTAKEFSAVAYFFGRKINDLLYIPVGLISVSWGSATVETWMDKETVSECITVQEITEIPNDKPQKVPTLLYNGMIHPVQDYNVAGFIWYQGESNRFKTQEYSILFPAMINQWRTQWGNPELPFYFVQIAPFGYGGKNSSYVREVQLKTMQKVKNTGMAVTMDIGDCQYIHPPQKRIVGERLAYWALAKDYNFDGISYSGPVYERMETTNDGKINLYFSSAEVGLISFGKKLEGFTIAGEDRIFKPAEALVNRNGSVTVSSPEVLNPVAVRYAFENCPKATLFNIAGLPASSFRTDDWEIENED